MRVTRPALRAAARGPSEIFTGTVWVETLKQAEVSRVSAALVIFEPRARTAWHAHPLGQLLIVVQGVGLVQKWGGEAELIRVGDVVWIEPGEKHWHGATDAHILAHIAIQEVAEGGPAVWFERVTDEQYEEARRTVREKIDRF